MQANSVMLVDDEPELLTVMTLMLEAQGFVVHGFTDPEKALAFANDGIDCSVIVSDIRMPIMNGFQLVRAVKKIHPEIKVILITAFNIHEKEWQKTLPSTEVNQFLIKPFDMSDLVESIEMCAPVH